MFLASSLVSESLEDCQSLPGEWSLLEPGLCIWGTGVFTSLIPTVLKTLSIFEINSFLRVDFSSWTELSVDIAGCLCHLPRHRCSMYPLGLCNLGQGDLSSP